MNVFNMMKRLHLKACRYSKIVWRTEGSFRSFGFNSDYESSAGTFASFSQGSKPLSTCRGFLGQQQSLEVSEGRNPVAPPSYRFIYPEFLPDPKPEWRNAIREKLERKDMLERRAELDIPEFYVGSILAVTSADKHAQSKVNRFVGICIERSGCGLRASFLLRNVIDYQGIEILYEMYDPKIQKIEVLRLEKRVDDHLRYLRNAPPEFSTFPLDMEPEILPENAPVPVNEIKVPLKPRPWLERWERQNLKGIQKLDLPEKFFKRAEQLATPWEKYDLVKQYRQTIPEEDQHEIYAEVFSELHQLEISRRKMKRRKVFIKPKKEG